jgi:hypothetical protein
MKNTINPRAAVADIRRRAKSATVEEATAILVEAQARCPVRTGELRDSGRVVETADGARIEFTADHAVVVHEDLDLQHAHGQAKFLESALLEDAPAAARNIAGRMKGES